jgi:hypothetical protein
VLDSFLLDFIFCHCRRFRSCISFAALCSSVRRCNFRSAPSSSFPRVLRGSDLDQISCFLLMVAQCNIDFPLNAHFSSSRNLVFPSRQILCPSVRIEHVLRFVLPVSRACRTVFLSRALQPGAATAQYRANAFSAFVSQSRFPFPVGRGRCLPFGPFSDLVFSAASSPAKKFCRRRFRSHLPGPFPARARSRTAWIPVTARFLSVIRDRRRFSFLLASFPLSFCRALAPGFVSTFCSILLAPAVLGSLARLLDSVRSEPRPPTKIVKVSPSCCGHFCSGRCPVLSLTARSCCSRFAMFCCRQWNPPEPFDFVSKPVLLLIRQIKGLIFSSLHHIFMVAS